jgi:hypothetical protein
MDCAASWPFKTGECFGGALACVDSETTEPTLLVGAFFFYASQSAAEAFDSLDSLRGGAVHMGRLVNKGHRDSRVVGSPSSIHVRRTSTFVTAAFARAVASPIVIGVTLKIIRYAC